MAFEPKDHLTKVKGQDYLEVRWRIAWFRDVHPEGVISTEVIPGPNGMAIFRAIASKEMDGPFAVGHGACRFDQFDAPYEKAETKAIGRALAALGFGVQFAASDFEEDMQQSRPQQAPPQQQRPPQQQVQQGMPNPGSGNQGANEQVAQQYQQQASPQAVAGGGGGKPSPGQMTFAQDLLTRKVYAEHHGEAIAGFNHGDMDLQSISRGDISLLIDHLKALPDLPGTPRYSR